METLRRQGRQEEQRQTLDWTTYLEAISSQRRGATGGRDGVCRDTWDHIPWNAHENIRAAMEARLNGDEGHTDRITAWTELDLVGVPRAGKNPHRLEGWRWVELAPNLQQVYEACVAKLAQKQVATPGFVHVGFQPGRGTQDIHAYIIMLLRRCKMHRKQVVVVQGDIKTAFQEVRAEPMDACLARRGVPKRLRAAMWTEQEEVNQTAHMGAIHTERVQKERAGRTGGKAMPRWWALMAAEVVEEVRGKWEKEGKGLWLRGDRWDYADYVDNFYITAGTPQEARSMLQDLAEAWDRAGMSFKPSSLEWMGTVTGGEESWLVWTGGEDR